MTNYNVAHPPEKSGRPSNRFTMLPTEYKQWKGAHVWEDKFEGLLAEGSCTGLTRDEDFMLDVVTAGGARDYVYTRLRSSGGEVDFAFPGVMRKADLPRLLKVWELDSLDWTNGPYVVLSGFPLSKWGFPWELAKPTEQSMWFMSFESEGVSQPMLRLRGGWATLFSKKNPTRRLATLIGPNLGDLHKVLTAAPSITEANVPFPEHCATAAMLACFEAGAVYFERKLLKPAPGKLVPWKPHAQLLGIDRSVYAELSL